MIEHLQLWARGLQHVPEVLIAASAVGFYGVPPADVRCDESAPAMPGVFQSDLCAGIENAAMRMEALGVRVVRMRLGVVLGRNGGAYPMQALPSRFGLGTRLGDGRHPAPWIHLEDALGPSIGPCIARTLPGPSTPWRRSFAHRKSLRPHWRIRSDERSGCQSLHRSCDG